MDFFAASAILVLYYIRPQDWVPGLAGANLIQPVALIAMMAVILQRRTRNNTFSGRVPHDWLMLIYGAYIVYTAPDFSEALKGFLPLGVFYWVTIESLDNRRRLGTYLRLWLGMLFCVAGLAVMSLFGFDLTGAVEMTERFKGRLAIGTWIHGNPNSLAHTVIVAIPICYFFMIWRQNLIKRLQALPLISMAAYCVYCAQSRGAFVAGAIIVAFAILIGRGTFARGLVIVFLATAATAMLSTLPRMNEDLRSDEGVQGRIMAWEIARTASRRDTTGEGWKKFEAYISYQGEIIRKATHSCYVRVAADLGYPGLFIYLAIIWISFRTVALRVTETDESERIRRVIMVLAVGYIISGWMIDRSYYVEYFLIAAVAGAFHRLSLSSSRNETLENQVCADMGKSELHPVILGKLFDRRFGIADALVSTVLTYGSLYMWDYILEVL